MCKLYLVNNNGKQFPVSMSVLRDRVINLNACLTPDGRFKIRGTKYIWCQKVKGHPTNLLMLAYGGYEFGGRGCFYVEVK